MLEVWDCLSAGTRHVFAGLGFFVAALFVLYLFASAHQWIDNKRCPLWTWPAIPIDVVLAGAILGVVFKSFHELMGCVFGG